MESKKPRVLVLSSANPYKGPGVVALNFYRAFINQGIDADFMTKFPVEGHPDFISVFKFSKEKQPLLAKLQDWRNLFFHRYTNKLIKKTGFYFFYQKESHPPVAVKKVINKITKKYDVVYIVFWQELLSFKTVEAIYDKLHCQIHFRCVDYSPMAGGCHFTGDCQQYKTGCGYCPGTCSKQENDFTRYNVQYRKEIYDKVKPIVYGNTYMHSFYRQSFLLKDYDRLEVVLPLVDNDSFYPMDMDACRKKWNIPDEKEFLIFFGSQHLDDERKGIKYLLEALKLFHDRLSERERKRIFLVLAGKNIEAIRDSLLFDYRFLGLVKPSDLPSVYSMSNVFLSPSINDAGPSMVNQSMSCGTPVVAFEMGTAIDVVKNKGTGYCAELKDPEDFARGISQLFQLPKEEYFSMRKKCRQSALEFTSEESFIKRFLSVFQKYYV